MANINSLNPGLLPIVEGLGQRLEFDFGGYFGDKHFINAIMMIFSVNGESFGFAFGTILEQPIEERIHFKLYITYLRLSSNLSIQSFLLLLLPSAHLWVLQSCWLYFLLLLIPLPC